MTRTALSLAVASALAAATSASVSAAPPNGQESCYGIALKGQNDCAAGNHSCAGESTMNYSKADFKYVPAGTCASMNVHGHKGSLTPS